MTYELIGSPRVQAEYSDKWETVMTVDMQREDGEVGEEVWIVAGVPGYLQGTAQAAGTHRGLMQVRVFGDSPDMWCPENLKPEDGDYAAVAAGIVAAVEAAAIETHTQAVQ